jgi:hypothetical protein
MRAVSIDAELDSLRRPSYPVAMPSILDLARYADVSAENVLRVLNGEPVSVEVAERVRDAVAALGSPRWPGLADGEEDADHVALEVIDHDEMFDARLPVDVGLVYEAVRVEVRPVNENIQAMQFLVDRLVSTLERMGESIEHERQERLEDVALVTELVVNGSSESSNDSSEISQANGPSGTCASIRTLTIARAGSAVCSSLHAEKTAAIGEDRSSSHKGAATARPIEGGRSVHHEARLDMIAFREDG